METHNPRTPQIQVLSSRMASRIAAGEVVERPASVVKELIENALDAGARSITVEFSVQDSCSIVVRDNGHGMEPDQVVKAVARHATSKLQEGADLEAISTFGFRGEALPSIASVSRFKITSRTREQEVGFSVSVEGEGPVETRPVAAPVGTAVEVKDLFFNVPVRQKFLKSATTEANHIIQICTNMALVNPHVHLRCVEDGRERISFPPVTTIRERLLPVLGGELAEQMIPVNRKGSLVHVTGAVSPPSVTRGRSNITMFVNGRYVRDRQISGAVVGAYRGVIEARRHPIVVLFLEMALDEVDVNVHPQKLEVRFRNPSGVNATVYTAVSEALQAGLRKVWGEGQGEPGAVSSEGMHPGESPIGGSPAGGEAGGEEGRVLRAARSGGGRGAGSFPVYSPLTGRYQWPAGAEGGEEGGVLPRERHDFQDVLPMGPGGTAARVSDGGRERIWGPVGGQEARGVEGLSHVVYIGQLHRTYLLLQGENSLILIDQHAAHERINYEKIRTSIRELGSLPSQALLVPTHLELDPVQARMAEEHAPLLTKLGLHLEPFGGNRWLVTGVPSHCPTKDVVGLVADVLEGLSQVKAGALDGVEWGGGVRDDRVGGSGGDGHGDGTGDGSPCPDGAMMEEEMFAALEGRLGSLWERMACHGSTRAGDGLSGEAALTLYRNLLTIERGTHCPHGRPTLIHLSMAELSRRFGRT